MEALIAHFRAACARYADAARGGEPRDEESSESDLDGGYNSNLAGGIEVKISEKIGDICHYVMLRPMYWALLRGID